MIPHAHRTLQFPPIRASRPNADFLPLLLPRWHRWHLTPPRTRIVMLISPNACTNLLRAWLPPRWSLARGRRSRRRVKSSGDSQTNGRDRRTCHRRGGRRHERPMGRRYDDGYEGTIFHDVLWMFYGSPFSPRSQPFSLFALRLSPFAFPISILSFCALDVETSFTLFFRLSIPPHSLPLLLDTPVVMRIILILSAKAEHYVY